MGSDDAFVISSYQRRNVCSLSLNGFRLMEILYMCISIPSSSCSVKTAVSMWIHSFTAVCNNCRFYFLCLQSLYNCKTFFLHGFLSFDCLSSSFPHYRWLSFFFLFVLLVLSLSWPLIIVLRNCSWLSSWGRWWCNKKLVWKGNDQTNNSLSRLSLWIFTLYIFCKSLFLEIMAEMQLIKNGKFQFPPPFLQENFFFSWSYAAEAGF